MIKESVTFSNRNWVLLFSMVRRNRKRGLSDSYMNDRGYESSFPIILSLFLIILLTKDHVIIFSAVVIDSPLQVTTCFSSFCFDQGAISFTWAKMARQILLSLTQQRRIPIPEILISAWKHANVVFKKFKKIVFQREEGGLNLSTQNCQGQKHVGRVVDIFSNWFCQNPLLHCILLST